MAEDLTVTSGPGGTATPERSAAPASPPGYELIDEIGRGGMGVVYRARDTALDRDVAVKLLSERYPADSSASQRFLSEARITGQLQHPGIPAVHQVGTLADGRPFLAMKLIKGSTLEVILQHSPDASADRGRLLVIFEAVCQAVGYAHAHRVIHRDLKPANVMVGAFGEVQVMDWGLAKVLGEGTPATLEASTPESTRAWTQVSPTPETGSHTQAGSLIGTPAFIAPEQAVGEIERVNERSDVFGLGALLAVILTGQPPYVGKTFESVRVQAVRGKLEECFARLEASGVEPELVALCKKCLAFEPTDRPTDAGAVAQAVAGFRAAADERARRAELERVRVEGEQATAQARSAERRKRRRLVVGAAAVLILAALGGLIAVLAVQRRANSDLAAKNIELEDEQTMVEAQNTKLESQKAEIETSLTKANQAEQVARVAEAAGRKLLYATDMQLAPFVWKDPQGTAAQLRARLDGHDPGKNKSLSGKNDLRGFEWYYYRHLLDHSSTVLNAGTSAIADFAATDDGLLVTLDRRGRLKQWDPDTHRQTAFLDSGRPPPDVPADGQHIRNGHPKLLSPNGQRLASAVDKTVVVQDTTTGEVSYRFEATVGLRDLIFSPNGRFLVTHDGKRSTWFDAANGRPVAHCDQALKDFDIIRPELSISADGLTLAVWAQGNVGNRISIFHLDPTEKIVTPPAEALDIDSSMGTVALSPDGKLIAVGAMFTGLISVYDTATRQQIAVHDSAHASPVSAIAFSRNGLDLATGDTEGVIKTWGDARKLTAKSDPQRTLKGHAGPITKVAFSGAGKQLISAGEDGTARLWELGQAQSAIRRLQTSYADPVFFAGGRLIATAERNRVTIWDAASGQRLRSLAEGDPILSLAISSDDRLLAVGRYLEGGPELLIRPSYLSLCEMDTGRRLAEFSDREEAPYYTAAYSALETLAFTPDGKFLVGGFGSRASHFSAEAIDLRVWEIATLREHKRLVGHSNACVSICFSADGTRMASGSHDGTARIWDSATWQAVGDPLKATDAEVRDDSVEAVSYSPDGRTLAMATMSGRIMLWNLQTRDRTALPRAHANSVNCVAFSPDGRTLASGSADHTIRLWNVATGRELMILNSKDLDIGPVRSLSFSRDGTQLLASSSSLGGGSAVIWSAAPSVWDEPALAANLLKPLLRSPVEFQSRIRLWSEIPQLREALETLDANDRQVQAALAAARANGHAARRRWREAAEEYDRLRQLSLGEPEAWLRTPGLIRIATALLHERRPTLATTLLTGGETRRAQDGLPAVRETDRDTESLWHPLLVMIEAGLDKKPPDPALLELRAELAGQWSGFSDQVRDYTAAIDALAAQPVERRQAHLQRLYRRRGDTHYRLKHWQASVDDYNRGITAEIQDPALFSRRAQANEELRDWRAASIARTRALEGDPDAGRHHAEFATRLGNANQFELASSHRKRAQTCFEAQLAREPENAALAAELAEVLLQESASVWTVLKSTELKSSGGATLTRLADGMIESSGKHPERDDYVVKAHPEVKNIRAIALDVLPRGRGDWGLCKITALEVFRLDASGSQQSVALNQAAADFEQADLWATYAARNVLARMDSQAWSCNSLFLPHRLVVKPTQAMAADTTALTIVIRQQFTYAGLTRGLLLGRFRLLVSDDPEAFEREQRRFAARKLTDPWARLGAAYALNGRPDEALTYFRSALERTEAYVGRKPIIEFAARFDTVLSALVQRQPDDPQLQLAMARKLAERGKQHLAEKQPAAAQAELQQSHEILTRLRAKFSQPEWAVLTPTAMTSEQGTTLTLQADGSVLASGKNPVADTYTLTAPVAGGAIAGLRLETIPDARFPGHGAGRAENRGDFVLSEVEAAMQTDGAGERVLVIKDGFADFSRDIQPIGHAFDSNSSTHWGVFPRLAEPHTAVFMFGPYPPPQGETGRLTIRLHCGANQYWYWCNLGRFRLSVTKDAETLHGAPLRSDLKESEVADLNVALAKALVQVGHPSEAVAVLRDATNADGNRADELKESDFDAIRGRDDFQKLLAELKAKSGPKAKPKD